MLKLWNGKPGAGLLHALLVPAFYPFRLKDDGKIDRNLLNAARLHDRLLKYLLYITFLGIVMLSVAVARTHSLTPLS